MLRTPSPTWPSSLVLAAVAGPLLAGVSGCCIQNPFDSGPKLQLKDDEQSMRELLLDLFPLGTPRREVLQTIEQHNIRNLEYRMVGDAPAPTTVEPSWSSYIKPREDNGQPVWVVRRLDRIEVHIDRHTRSYLPGCNRVYAQRMPEFMAAAIEFGDEGVSRVEVFSYMPRRNVSLPYEFEITAED